MSCIDDLKEKFQEYKIAMKKCLPQVDERLVTEILHLMEK